jgi:hypothetical protein
VIAAGLLSGGKTASLRLRSRRRAVTLEAVIAFNFQGVDMLAASVIVQNSTHSNAKNPGVLAAVFDDVRARFDQPSNSDLRRTIRLFAVHSGVDKDRLCDLVMRSFTPVH